MKYNPRIKKELLRLLKRTGGDIKAAAAALGVSRQSVYQWKNKDKDLAMKMEELRYESILEIEDCLFDNAKGGNVTAQIFILANLYPEKYRHLSKIDFNKTENEFNELTNAEMIAQIEMIKEKLGIESPKDIEDIEHEEIDG